MKPNRSAQAVLEQYREATSPSVATRERLLTELAQRAALFEMPSVSPPAPPSLVPETASAGWASTPVWVAGGLLSTSALLLTAFWLWRAPEPPGARAAQAVNTSSPRQLEAPAASEPLAPQHGPEPRSTTELKAESNDSRATAAGPRETAPSVPPAVGAPAPRRQGSETSARTEGLPSDGASAVDPSTKLTQAPRSVARAATSRTATSATTSGAATSRAATSRAATSLLAEGDELEDELRLVRSAYEALRAKKPHRALGWLDEHVSRFPYGALSESREIARIMALCQAEQRTEARAKAARFLELSPHSPHAARVRSLCTEPPDDP